MDALEADDEMVFVMPQDAGAAQRPDRTQVGFACSALPSGAFVASTCSVHSHACCDATGTCCDDDISLWRLRMRLNGKSVVGPQPLLSLTRYPFPPFLDSNCNTHDGGMHRKASTTS